MTEVQFEASPPERTRGTQAALLRRCADGETDALETLFDRFGAQTLLLMQNILSAGPEAGRGTPDVAALVKITLSDLWAEIWQDCSRWEDSGLSEAAWIITATREFSGRLRDSLWLRDKTRVSGPSPSGVDIAALRGGIPAVFTDVLTGSELRLVGVAYNIVPDYRTLQATFGTKSQDIRSLLRRALQQLAPETTNEVSPDEVVQSAEYVLKLLDDAEHDNFLRSLGQNKALAGQVTDWQELLSVFAPNAEGTKLAPAQKHLVLSHIAGRETPRRELREVFWLVGGAIAASLLAWVISEYL